MAPGEKPVRLNAAAALVALKKNGCPKAAISFDQSAVKKISYTR